MNQNSGFWNSGGTDDGSKNPAFEDNATALALSEARRVYSTLGFGYAIYAAVSLIVALVIQVAVLLVSPDLIENTLFLNILSPVSLYLFALPALILVLVLFCIKGETPEKRKLGLGAWTLILLVSFGLMYIGSFMGQGVMWGVSKIVGYDYSNILESVIDYDNMWITVIFMCVIAPIGEELVFRKLIIDRTHKYGGLVSVLVSGLIFGLMHANFYQFFYAFALGLVLGYVYYGTGRIWYTIALHATINFIGSVVTAYLDLGLTQMSEAFESLNAENAEELIAFAYKYGLIIVAEYAFLAFVIVSIICSVVLPIVFRKKINLERSELLAPPKKMLAAAFLNVGVIVMLVVYVIQFALNLIPPNIGQ